MSHGYFGALAEGLINGKLLMTEDEGCKFVIYTQVIAMVYNIHK